MPAKYLKAHTLLETTRDGRTYGVYWTVIISESVCWIFSIWFNNTCYISVIVHCLFVMKLNIATSFLKFGTTCFGFLANFERSFLILRNIFEHNLSRPTPRFFMTIPSTIQIRENTRLCAMVIIRLDFLSFFLNHPLYIDPKAYEAERRRGGAWGLQPQVSCKYRFIQTKMNFSFGLV